jgi:hypothetical protein
MNRTNVNDQRKTDILGIKRADMNGRYLLPLFGRDQARCCSDGQLVLVGLTGCDRTLGSEP